MRLEMEALKKIKEYEFQVCYLKPVVKQKLSKLQFSIISNIQTAA
jgi:hypothetical protein